MRFDQQLFDRAQRLAGLDSDMNDQLQIYRSAIELLGEPWCPAGRRAEFEYLAAEAERKIRNFIRRKDA